MSSYLLDTTLDECVPARLKDILTGHAVQTVPQIGWRSTKDRPLLDAVEGRYDVFLTVDRKLEKQHDLTAYRMGFVLVRLPNNRIESFQQVRDEILKAVESVRPGEVIQVISPGFRG